MPRYVALVLAFGFSACGAEETVDIPEVERPQMPGPVAAAPAGGPEVDVMKLVCEAYVEIASRDDAGDLGEVLQATASLAVERGGERVIRQTGRWGELGVGELFVEVRARGSGKPECDPLIERLRQEHADSRE
ncbi:MAG: hypothetical protein AAGF12_24920 [Myxococcota bacterium]